MKMSAARPAERIKAPAAVAILGVPLRTVQAMAAKGELPTAALLCGRWTFNEAALRAYVRDREDETCRNGEPRRAVIGGARRSGAAPRLRAGNTDGACERTIQRLLQLAKDRKRSG
jgi:hypothetical protein